MFSSRPKSAKRESRVALAEQTLRALESGRYTASHGRVVELAGWISECVAGSRLYLPEDRERLLAAPASERGDDARIEVQAETTLAGARILAEAGGGRIGVLNFASARNPGGGFLGGSQAQEESLARSSALYPSLLSQRAFYDHHRAESDLLYSHRVIVSPDCPVLRDDAGAWLEVPYRVTFLTAPAPNAGAVAKNQPASLGRIPAVLRERAEFVLAVAHEVGCERLVLGAWGCGVFRNDPAMVAAAFAMLLSPGSRWRRAFREIRFSVYDETPDRLVLRSFEHQLLTP